MVFYFLTEIRRIIYNHFQCPHITVVADIYREIEKWPKFLSYLPEKLTKHFRTSQMLFLCVL